MISCQRLIVDDALPKKTDKPWVRELFQEVLHDNASSHWRTSKTANQNFNLMHKFLRCSGLLDCDTLEEFHKKRTDMGSDGVIELCRNFTDTFCTTAASAKRYLVVFNHLFHRVWGMVPQKMNAMGKRKRIHTLAELDDKLSQTTCSTVVRGARFTKADYFDDAELHRIRVAADVGPDRLRNNLVISLLETTGLRRMGVLNILLCQIAEYNEDESRSRISQQYL